MRKVNFQEGWTFKKEGDAEFNSVSIPHDAMLEGGRDSTSPSGSAGAYFKGGSYHYRKQFNVEKIPAKMVVEFEGIYHQAKIKVNEFESETYDYGYLPIAMDIRDYLVMGENTIEVFVDNDNQPNSRWYTGSGIYRPVWMYEASDNFIEYQGVKIETISTSPSIIRVQTKHVGGDVEVEILDQSGKVIAHGSGDDIQIEIENAKLWSVENPYLYTAHVRLMNNGEVADDSVINFGVRTIHYDASGFYINGIETLLRGGCVHHDNGILGAKSFRESEYRRIKIMKEAGYNAIRISHNPASVSMLEACDELGMYVIDETWDMWFSKKSKYDYATKFMKNYRNDIEVLINRDFNHPSVIMYSIGNEVTEPAHEKGLEILKEMVDLVHALDDSRPVTCGFNLWLLYKSSAGKGVYDEGSNSKSSKQMNSTVFNMVASKVGTKINNGARSKKADAVISPALDVMDIAGYNYSSGRYPLEGSVNPGRIIVGSETYPQDIYKNWEMVKKYPYLIGDFVWTSWDYLGEVGLGAWAYTDDAATFDKPYPWILADTGTINILGDIGAQADYAATVWGLKDAPSIHVRPVKYGKKKPVKMVWRGTDAMPSWSWKDCEGNRAVVEVYSNAHSITLSLNGKTIGNKKLKECKAIFKTTYDSGVLVATAYDAQGNVMNSSILESAIGQTSIRMESENVSPKIGEIIYVNIDIVGENDIVESNDDHEISVSVEGGTLLGYGSANPRTEENYLEGKFTTYYGRSQAIIKVNDPVVSIAAGSKQLGTKTLVIGK